MSIVECTQENLDEKNHMLALVTIRNREKGWSNAHTAKGY